MKDLSHLQQKWIHSKEESNATQMVYRPASYKLAPVREGRASLELKDNGNLLITGTAGPDDRLKKSQATWKLDGDKLIVYPAPGEKEEWQILEISNDKLIMTRK